MTVAQAIRKVLANTEHDVGDSDDGDGQVTPEQIVSHLDSAVKHVRAKLADDVPALYSATGDETTLTGGSSSCTITLPEDFHKLLRVEQLFSQDWEPVSPADDFAPDRGPLNWREHGGEVVFAPARQAVGTFRLIYTQTPEDLDPDNDNQDLGLPPTLADVAVERASGFAMRRGKEDLQPYLDAANAIYQEQLPLLRRRHRQPVIGSRYVEPRSMWRNRS